MGDRFQYVKELVSQNSLSVIKYVAAAYGTVSLFKGDFEGAGYGYGAAIALNAVDGFCDRSSIDVLKMQTKDNFTVRMALIGDVTKLDKKFGGLEKTVEELKEKYDSLGEGFTP
jgi:hypothetical protein